MTTTTWASAFDHSSDATFRTWGSEFAAKLAVVGLVQTADTGQINWTTVTRPGNNTAAGYEIWRFADSSLYMKIEYGTSTSAAVPNMWITVGTGSNGSGTITGQTNTRNTFCNALTITSTITNYTSYMSHTADSFSVAWKLGGSGGVIYVTGVLVVGKTVDGTGAATTTGFGVWRQTGNASLSLQSVRTAATAAAYTDTSSGNCAIPGLPTTSLAGSDFQAYTIYLNLPQVVPFNWAAAIVVSDIPRGVSYSTAMVGTTPRTFISLGSTNGSSSIALYANAFGAAMIYE